MNAVIGGVPATALGTWAIAVLATAGVIIRPWRLPEAIWAVLGAVALVAFGLLPWRAALAGVGKGLDVYLFLAGMMLLAELARQEGLFDWLASFAVEHAGGSPQRLFVLVYAVGTVVTVFLSNDATAVVLTPAVYAATRAAGATPLPYLFACAFIANAASFALPISNPANLVVFAGRVIARAVARPKLMRGGRHAAYGIAATAVALTACSAFDLQLGLPTFICGGATAAIILAVSRGAPILQRAWTLLRHIAWGVLPLVAGLFVLVEALAQTGVIAALARLLASGVAASVTAAAWTSGVVIAVACNLMNNLPVGLIAGSVVGSEHVPPTVTGAALIGVDLGPNLSVTGSLATILWLASLRRERVEVGALRFLMVGLAVTPPALVLALAALMA